jgi:hypothetical protein
MTFRALAVSLLACCSKPALPPAPPAPASLLARAPASATLYLGYNRGGADLDLTRLPLGPMKQIPPCVLDVVGKVEALVAAVDPVDPPRIWLAARGARLRPALEACARTLEPRLSVVEEGKATCYVVGNDRSYVLWLDEATVLLQSTAKDASAAAALGDTKAPASADPKAAALLAKVHTASALWFVADLNTWRSGLLADLHVPTRVWGELGASDLSVRAEMPTPEDAAKLVAKVQAGLASAPPALVQGVHVVSAGTLATLEAPVRALLAQATGTPIEKLQPSTTSVVTVGMLAAIAIPAFMKNARKAKTTEAVVGVKKIFDGAREFWEVGHTLPPSTEITPPLGACCKQPEGRCAPDPTLWTSPAWLAVRFSMDDPHRYSYQLVTDATSFTARAFGDLNCDGTYSTFELVGRIQADGSVASPDGVRRVHELE